MTSSISHRELLHLEYLVSVLSTRPPSEKLLRSLVSFPIEASPTDIPTIIEKLLQHRSQNPSLPLERFLKVQLPPRSDVDYAGQLRNILPLAYDIANHFFELPRPFNLAKLSYALVSFEPKIDSLLSYEFSTVGPYYYDLMLSADVLNTLSPKATVEELSKWEYTLTEFTLKLIGPPGVDIAAPIPAGCIVQKMNTMYRERLTDCTTFVADISGLLLWAMCILLKGFRQVVKVSEAVLRQRDFLWDHLRPASDALLRLLYFGMHMGLPSPQTFVVTPLLAFAGNFQENPVFNVNSASPSNFWAKPHMPLWTIESGSFGFAKASGEPPNILDSLTSESRLPGDYYQFRLGVWHNSDGLRLSFSSSSPAFWVVRGPTLTTQTGLSDQKPFPNNPIGLETWGNCNSESAYWTALVAPPVDGVGNNEANAFVIRTATKRAPLDFPSFEDISLPTSNLCNPPQQDRYMIWSRKKIQRNYEGAVNCGHYNGIGSRDLPSSSSGLDADDVWLFTL